MSKNAKMYQKVFLFMLAVFCMYKSLKSSLVLCCSLLVRLSMSNLNHLLGIKEPCNKMMWMLISLIKGQSTVQLLVIRFPEAHILLLIRMTNPDLKTQSNMTSDQYAG